ncbi:hypothetical protein Asi03nite_17150 [Actinoplanes siamensis]|uniref:Uncharacterized protein n=1 Tax=Actinoplanes siamensis TaxID=1223317 RepID=A0A919TIL8_9ACTN|nr:hypothetical protein Asi03nite_17150 [Actinoplanes siamensis]
MALRLRWWCRRSLRFTGRAVMRGLQHYGACYAGVPVFPPAPPLPGSQGPPLGHPERLAVDLPLSAAETQLWAQLGHFPGP